MMTFFVKDHSTMKNIHPHKCLLYTFGKTCADFFGTIQPCNLYLDANRRHTYAIERVVRRLCKFNIAVDAMVERVAAQNSMSQVTLRLVDCKLIIA